MLRKIGIIAVLSLIIAAVAAVPALAQQGLHFVGEPTATATADLAAGTATLTSTGEVAGAGTGGEAILTSTAVVSTGCINPGSMDQQPRGLRRTTETVTASEPFTTNHGRGTFDVSADVSLDRTCPGQQEPVLLGVTFTDVTLTIDAQTGEISEDFGDIVATT
jgi:hypothetical protein